MSLDFSVTMEYRKQLYTTDSYSLYELFDFSILYADYVQ